MWRCFGSCMPLLAHRQVTQSRSCWPDRMSAPDLFVYARGSPDRMLALDRSVYISIRQYTSAWWKESLGEGAWRIGIVALMGCLCRGRGSIYLRYLHRERTIGGKQVYIAESMSDVQGRLEVEKEQELQNLLSCLGLDTGEGSGVRRLEGRWWWWLTCAVCPWRSQCDTGIGKRRVGSDHVC